jgi:2-alkenal reductase
MLRNGDDGLKGETSLAGRTQAREFASTGLVVSLVAFGVLLGLLMAWLSFGSSWSPWSNRTVLFDEKLITSLVEAATPAVVEISVGMRRFESKGSGFLVDGDGHIVTNSHVVASEGDISVKLSDGRTLDATLLGISRADDLAVLQVDPAEVARIAPLRLADTDQVRTGQLAIAVGSPFQQFNSVTVGVVSGLGRSQRGDTLNRPIPELVQTDAKLNPGNSGGPLLNARGEVIGVNSAVQIAGSPRDLSLQTGVGFAISSNTLRDILPDLLTPGEFKRPWLGVMSVALTRNQFEALEAPVEAGVYIAYVCGGSPADDAGLRGERFVVRPTGPGDLITAIDGNPVATVADMVSHINTLRPGDGVVISLIRNEAPIEVDVTLAEWMDTCL